MILDTTITMNVLGFDYFFAEITLIFHNFTIKNLFKKYPEIIESYYKNVKRVQENI
jgi:hypothetical protein